VIRHLLAGTGLALALSATAAETGHEIRGGVTYSDNVLRGPPGSEIDSGTVFVGLRVFNSRPQGRLRYDVSVDLGYYEYLEVDVDQNLQGRATLEGAYDIIPETFSWNAGVSYDQIRQDLLRAVAPDNVEGVSRFWTGPSLRAQIASQTQAVLSGNFAFVDYADRDADNEVVGGRLQILHQSSPQFSVGPGISYDHQSYPSSAGAGSADFDRQEAFLRADYRGERSELGVEFGYAQFKSGDTKDDGPMLRGNFSRQLTPTLEAFVSASREYPLTGPGYGVSPYSAGGPYDNSILTAAPHVSIHLDLGLRFDRARTGGELVWAKHKEDAQLAGAGTRHYDEWRGRLTRRITPRTSGSLYGVWTQDDISASTAPASDERMLGANLDLSFGRALGVGVWFESRDRNHSGAYSEISGGLFVTWGKRYGAGPGGPSQ
jgi:hypothetical protein